MDDAGVMTKLGQLMGHEDADFVAQMCAMIKSDLVDYVKKHNLDVTIENIPPLISPFAMRDRVFNAASFADINDQVARHEEFHVYAELDKTWFKQCFTSSTSMDLANTEVFQKVDGMTEKKLVFIFPPLLLRHTRPEPDVLLFKRTPSDMLPTAMLMFLAMGAVIPVAFDVVAFKALLARYHFYSLENMNADEVRAYLIAQK
jgi:hypothetical protein